MYSAIHSKVNNNIKILKVTHATRPRDVLSTIMIIISNAIIMWDIIFE